MGGSRNPFGITPSLVHDDFPDAIHLWFGIIGTIPAGFQLCDGTNGTPDLRNQFVVGSGDTYNPDDSGAAAGHDHDFTGDGHFHDLGAFPPSMAAGTDFDDTTSTDAITGTTNPTVVLPPFKSLAYIMEL